MRAFSMILPGGWTRVDLQDPTSLDQLGKTMVRAARPVDQPAIRASFDGDVRPGLEAFATKGVAAVVLPLVGVLDLPVRPFLSIRPLPETDVDPILYLSALAQGQQEAESWHTPTMAGLRTRSVVEGVAGASDEQLPDDLAQLSRQLGVPEKVGLDSVHLGYTLGDSDERHGWLMVQAAIGFPTTAEGRDIAAQAERLVDSMISTLRWVS